MEIVVYSLISWVSILVTMCVYIILWRKHSVHGWTQLAFLVSAFLYFFIVFLRKLHRNWDEQRNPSLTIDRLFTFFTLAHCTNVVNLSAHIFWTFLKAEPEIPIRKIGDLSAPLFKPLVICWTFPALITIIELFVSEGTEKVLERGVLVALICLNFVIIMVTVGLIVRLIREGQNFEATSNYFQFKDTIFLFVRLFCITGLIWTVKAIPLLVIQRDADRTGGFWKVMDFLSDSYGFIIFLVFIYNTRILTALTDYPMLRKLFLFGCNRWWCEHATKETNPLNQPKFYSRS